MSTTKLIITPLLKYELVEFIKDNVFPTYANTYVGIGRPIRWGDDADPEANNEIEEAIYTTDYRNQVFRDMVALKRVAAADTALVVPRVDWASGTTYDEYFNDVELFSHTKKTTLTGTVNATGNLISSNTLVWTGNVFHGNIISMNSETRQIVGMINSTHVAVNTNFTYAVSDGTVIRLDSTYPRYANNFYVRNSRDQVFKVIHRPYGVASTSEPTIDIDGQLPENPWIQTADGYRWKYLYTIPYGLKQKFFTSNWMPVISDNAVLAGAVNGEINHLHIYDGGSGYFLDNGESGNSNSLSIITISGDGEGVVATAKVESGVITDINILDGGSGYTYTTITIDDPDQLANGNTANLFVTITPPGGHGSSPVKELGCYSVMTSVDFVGTETDTIPVGSDTVPFDFRQISLIRDPVLANGSFATASVYRSTTKLDLTDPGVTNYTNDEVVYIGTSEAEATFTGIVVDWDATTNALYINNLRGNVVVGSTLTGVNSAATTTILGIEEPDVELFSGDLLYIENRQKIVRDTDQTEQVRLVLSL
jgi:hypothetical protein